MTMGPKVKLGKSLKRMTADAIQRNLWSLTEFGQTEAVSKSPADFLEDGRGEAVSPE